ncbi:hypothetical protein O5D80_004239 [Batrachochytrium dendrobatidis]|nr:hypothetical protein O5D80_004239 [Batrachochytrium dendrobatidis]
MSVSKTDSEQSVPPFDPDCHVLHILDLVDECITRQDMITKSLSKAYFNLAQTKYILGPSRLTQHQYDRRMQTQIPLSISVNEQGIMQVNSIPTEPESSTQSNTPLQETCIDSEESESHKQSESALRHRKKIQHEPNLPTTTKVMDSDSDTASDSKESKSSQSADTKPTHIRDPLHWFGLLVPSHLRESQQQFKAGLDHLILLANLKSQIVHTLQKYEDAVQLHALDTAAT